MEWISVKDRLPEEGVEVLTWSRGVGVLGAEYITSNPEDQAGWTQARFATIFDYWMPLPEPPEAADDCPSS